MRRLAQQRTRLAAKAALIARMSAIAALRLRAVGFCTDQDFRAAGFTAEIINAHGNRARHRAVHVMAKERDRLRHRPEAATVDSAIAAE